MNDTASEVRSQVSEAEWDLRVDLAACYRLVALYRWDDLIFTHISARVPGPDHHFLINPYGLLFEEITASSLVKVDIDGRKVINGPYDINPAGFTIHSAIHAAREDAKCVLHLHSRNGVAVAAQKNGVLPISQHSIFVLASLAYHDYEGLALNEDEKPRLVRDGGQAVLHAAQPWPAHGRGDGRQCVPLHVLLRDCLRDPSACASRRRADPAGAMDHRWRRGTINAGHEGSGRCARLACAAPKARST
jgi:ribulose-5-phosphate 4-epimerase/fuculose-1-phosphate aldolase